RYFAHQPDPRAFVEPVDSAVRVDRHTFHVLHGQPGSPIGNRAPVDQMRDVRMPDSGQDATFRAEPRQEMIGVEAPAKDLDRDLLPEVSVRALGQVYGAHAT